MTSPAGNAASITDGVLTFLAGLDSCGVARASACVAHDASASVKASYTLMSSWDRGSYSLLDGIAGFAYPRVAAQAW